MADQVFFVLMALAFLWLGYMLGRRQTPSENAMIEMLVKRRAAVMVEAIWRAKILKDIDTMATDLVRRTSRE